MRRRLLPAWLLAAAGCTFNPGAAQQSLVAGDMRMVQKDYRGAIGMYDQAIAADPYLREAFLHRGVAYRGHGDYARSLADLNRAIELDPNFSRAFTERARTKLARIAAQADGDRIQLADAFSRADPHGLTADLDRAVALDAQGGDNTALLVRGAVRLMQGRDADAQQDFDRFARLRAKVKPDLEDAIAKWKKERPVFDPTALDDLCRVRPLRG